jgi:hypothetical protein
MTKHRSFRLTRPSPQDCGRGLSAQTPMMRSSKRLLGVLSLAGLVASMAVHVLALCGIEPPRASWLLHVGIFVVWIPMICIWGRIVVSRQAGWSFAAAQQAHGELFWRSLQAVPTQFKVAFAFCFAYYLALSGLGIAKGAVFVSFSAGWMFFYSIAVVFFSWMEPAARKLQEAQPGAGQVER